MLHRLRHHRTLSTVVLGVSLAITLAACGGASAASNGKIASLTSDPVGTNVTATTDAVSSQQAALNFVACLREQGLNVADPKFDANGNLTGGILGPNSGIDRTSPTTRTAIQACRSKLGNVGFGGGGGRFDPTVLQAAFNDFTSCLRSKGLDVQDVTFGRRPDGASGAGGVGGGGGPGADGTGPRGGFGGPPDGTGPRGGQGFDPTQRLLDRLGLDQTDPKVKAAVTACEPILTKAFTNTTSTTVAN